MSSIFLHHMSVISLILTHLFFSQITMFKILCVTNNNIVWTIFVLNFGTFWFFPPFLTHFVSGSLFNSKARWQMMMMAHLHGFSIGDLFLNIFVKCKIWTLHGHGDLWFKSKNCCYPFLNVIYLLHINQRYPPRLLKQLWSLSQWCWQKRIPKL